MARYISAEEHFDCPECDTRFTLREAHHYREETYMCPLCENAFWRFGESTRFGKSITLWQSTLGF